MNIYEEVRGYKRIGISGHIRPDGDCIGAVLSLYLYLSKRMEDAEVFAFLEKPSNSFRNIPGIEKICSEGDYSHWKKMDVFIALDTVPDRMGAASYLFDHADKTINIDHHISNRNGSAMVNHVVPEAAATCELIYEVIDHAYLDKDIAQLIYMGIAHDTGVFHFSNTSPKIMRIAADLMEYQFDFPKLIDETFYEKTYLQNQVQSRIVLESRRYFDGKIIVGSADGNFMKQYGVSKNDFEGVVNQLRITEGVECSVFIYENPNGKLKCSLRSSSDLVDVSKIAMEYGGGGHVRAAGFDSDLEIGLLESRLVEAVTEQLKTNSRN